MPPVAADWRPRVLWLMRSIHSREGRTSNSSASRTSVIIRDLERIVRKSLCRSRRCGGSQMKYLKVRAGKTRRSSASPTCRSCKSPPGRNRCRRCKRHATCGNSRRARRRRRTRTNPTHRGPDRRARGSDTRRARRFGSASNTLRVRSRHRSGNRPRARTSWPRRSFPTGGTRKVRCSSNSNRRHKCRTSSSSRTRRVAR